MIWLSEFFQALCNVPAMTEEDRSNIQLQRTNNSHKTPLSRSRVLLLLLPQPRNLFFKKAFYVEMKMLGAVFERILKSKKKKFLQLLTFWFVTIRIEALKHEILKIILVFLNILRNEYDHWILRDQMVLMNLIIQTIFWHYLKHLLLAKCFQFRSGSESYLKNVPELKTLAYWSQFAKMHRSVKRVTKKYTR